MIRPRTKVIVMLTAKYAVWVRRKYHLYGSSWKEHVLMMKKMLKNFIFTTSALMHSYHFIHCLLQLAVTVDEVYGEQGSSAGAFTSLPLEYLYLGGSENTMTLPGTKASSNFVGCMRKVKVWTINTLCESANWLVKPEILKKTANMHKNTLTSCCLSSIFQIFHFFYSVLTHNYRKY